MRDLSICPLHASLNSFLSFHRNSISVRPFDHFIQKCIILLIGIILGPPLYETCHRRYVYVIVGSSSFSFLFLFQIWDLYENGNNCCTRRSTLSSFSVGPFFSAFPWRSKPWRRRRLAVVESLIQGAMTDRPRVGGPASHHQSSASGWCPRLLCPVLKHAPVDV